MHLEGNISLSLIFVNWYYKEAYFRVWKYIKAIQIINFDVFSVRILFKTLFAPWKRDVISYEGLTIKQRFEVWSLNVSSRIIGFLMKTFVLLAYIFAEAATLIVSVAALIIWPILPLLAIYSIVFGFTLI